MQDEQYLRSQNNLVTQKKSRALSIRSILLFSVGLIFATFGFVDAFSRVFLSAPSADGAPILEDRTVETTAITEPTEITTAPLTLASPFAPVRIRVPALHIDAVVESVGRKADGTMKTPSTFKTTAWFNEGSLAGAEGNTVIAGHLNNAITTSGVFEHLDALSLGETIILTDENGKEARYIVREMTVYETLKAPNDIIFATEGTSRVVLITCNGAWDKGKRSYDKRLVIFADLI